MGNKVIANIREDYGRLYVRDIRKEKHPFVSADDLRDIIARLTETYVAMVTTGKTQYELYFDVEMGTTSAAMAEVRIEYPFIHPFAVYNKTGVNRPRKTPRFSGVYVIGLEQSPDRVKIGYSIDLYERTKGIRYELETWQGVEDPIFQTVAFIHTKYPQEIERILHAKFAKANIWSEWFQREPVEEWLQQFRSAS